MGHPAMASNHGTPGNGAQVQGKSPRPWWAAYRASQSARNSSTGMSSGLTGPGLSRAMTRGNASWTKNPMLTPHTGRSVSSRFQKILCRSSMCCDSVPSRVRSPMGGLAFIQSRQTRPIVAMSLNRPPREVKPIGVPLRRFARWFAGELSSAQPPVLDRVSAATARLRPRASWPESPNRRALRRPWPGDMVGNASHWYRP
jgi:hypothetical protein